MKPKPTTPLLALCAIALTGCIQESEMGKVNTDQRFLNSVNDRIVTAKYNGHSYIIYKGSQKGGITHDPDCPCHQKGGTDK